VIGVDCKLVISSASMGMIRYPSKNWYKSNKWRTKIKFHFRRRNRLRRWGRSSSLILLFQKTRSWLI